VEIHFKCFAEKIEKNLIFHYLFFFGGAITHPQQITTIPGIRSHELPQLKDCGFVG